MTISGMRCPYPGCELGLKVKNSRNKNKKRTGSPSETVRTRRLRYCDNGHKYMFTEYLDGWSLNEVTVRKSGNHTQHRDRILGNRFNRERLYRDINDGVMELLSTAELREVVRGVIEKLQDDLPAKAQFATPEEWEHRRASNQNDELSEVYIWDSDVGEAVEHELKKAGHRVPHVIYAATAHGRSVGDRRGWRNATDLLEWLFQKGNYPDLAFDLPKRVPSAKMVWHPAKPSMPEYVLKAGRVIATNSDGSRMKPDEVEEVLGRLVTFNISRFMTSIQRALIGRPVPGDTATNVAWWVLTELQGQERVHSAQLAVGVLDCLRRVDDIAYLRWATHRKIFPQVTNLVSEALGLLENPSDHLEFSKSPAPRRNHEFEAQDSAISQAFAVALKAARAEQDLSIDQVAARSGVSADACAGLENLTRSLSVTEFAALASAVGIDLAALFDGVDEGDDYKGAS